jgi:hypothetical protein
MFIATENGELTVLNTSKSVVLDAIQETVVGPNLVHAKKATLILSRRDAAKLRKALGAMLRKPRPDPRPQSEAMAVSMETAR